MPLPYWFDPPSNPELEAAIFAEPDELGPYLVYGDWLQSIGDLRGELIAVHFAQQQTPDSIDLRAREVALCEELGSSWSWLLREKARIELEWRLGFVDGIRLRSLREPRFEVDATWLRDVLTLPATRMLRSLALTADIDGQGSHGNIRNLEEILTLLPTVERLQLYGQNLQIAWIELPKLRYLQMDAPQENWTLLTLATPLLETLIVHDGYDLAQLRAILDGEITSLRNLGLPQTSLDDELYEELIASPTLARLESLEVRCFELSGEGWSRLRTQAAFSHLRQLRIRQHDNLSEAERNLVFGLCPDVK